MNILDVLTPKPPFNPARKNQAVHFSIPNVSIALHSTGEKIKGINRTQNTFKL